MGRLSEFLKQKALEFGERRPSFGGNDRLYRQGKDITRRVLNTLLKLYLV